MSNVSLSIVVPVYKEESNVRPFLDRAENVLARLNVDYEIIFALDPSPDNTEEIIREEMKRNHRIGMILFSRKFGQPAATLAGILHCRGDACVIIDVDLQDPPELIPALMDKWKEGFSVVYAKRRKRKGETVVKKIVSKYGYKIINAMSEMEIPRDTGDFRIIDRRVIEELRKLNECHGFLRGLVAFVGFKQTFVEYDRDERAYGDSKYNKYLGSLKIGMNGLVSFSSKPLHYISLVGILTACLGFILGISYVIQKITGMDLTPGLSTTVVLVTFFSGIQLFCVGLMGEYVGRIYDEVKRRPLYIIDRKENV